MICWACLEAPPTLSLALIGLLITALIVWGHPDDR